MKEDNKQSMQRTRPEAASFVIKSIRELGVQPHAESRLMRMYRVLTDPTRRVDPVIRPDDPDIEIARESTRDITQLEFVFDCLEAHSNTDDLVRIVKILLKDSVLPQGDRGQSKGRDRQFELFVAAVCHGSDLRPVKLEEPDVTCSVQGSKFGIAAKRVKSLKNLEKHLRKAAKQIEGARLPGMIALDTCVALNPENRRFWVQIPDREFSRLHADALRRFVGDHYERIQEWVRGKGVRGIVIHDLQIRLEPSGEWALAGMTYFVCTARENERRNREFRTFKEKYRKGLPNLQHL